MKAGTFRDLLLDMSCFSSCVPTGNICLIAELRAKKKYILKCWKCPAWATWTSMGNISSISSNVTTRDSRTDTSQLQLGVRRRPVPARVLPLEDSDMTAQANLGNEKLFMEWDGPRWHSEDWHEHEMNRFPKHAKLIGSFPMFRSHSNPTSSFFWQRTWRPATARTIQITSAKSNSYFMFNTDT
jgi:hypothetical protein